MANTMTSNDSVQRAEESSAEEAQPTSEPPRKKARKVPLKWSEELHRDFVSAIFDFGVTNASPSVILKQMMTNDSEVTSERVKSHLQKYRVNRDRSKEQFMSEYDESLRRIKERDGAKWHSTDKFSSGDVAAAMVYYCMNPEAPITMPFDMRRSAAAGANNVPTARGGTDPSTGVTHDGAVYSDHRSGPNMDMGMPQPTPNMHPASSAVANSNGDRSGAHQSNSSKDDPAARGDGTTISMPSLTTEEYNSPLGTTLRYLTGLCNSMTDHLLEIRHASSSAPATAETNQSSRQTSDSTSSGTHNSNTYPPQPPYNSAPGPYSHVPYPQHVHPGAQPIHPHGYMPPGGGEPPPPELAPSYGYYPPHHLPLGDSHHGAPAPVPTSYSHQHYHAGSNYPYTSNSNANVGNETSNRGHDAKFDESKATPLYNASRLRSDRTSDYVYSGSGGDRAATTAAAVPPLSTKSSYSPAVSPTRSSTYNNHSHSITSSNKGNPSSSPSQGWGYANDGKHPVNDYTSAHNATYSHHHHPDGGHGGGSANQGQNNDSNSTRSNQEYRPEQSSPTNMTGLSKDLGDPWDEVPYSPIAH